MGDDVMKEMVVDQAVAEKAADAPVIAEADPFDSWEDIFPELAQKADEPVTPEEPAAKTMSEEEVRRLVREEIKKWVKGVSEGKYPFPKGAGKNKPEETTEEPSKYPYPSKEDVKSMNEALQKSFDEKLTRFDVIEKSLATLKAENDAMRKEIEIIRDQPAQIIEKSLEKKPKSYKSPYKVKEDGTIEFH